MHNNAMVGYSLLFAAGALVPGALFAGLYGDIPNATHAWAVHDTNRPKPSRVTGFGAAYLALGALYLALGAFSAAGAIK